MKIRPAFVPLLLLLALIFLPLRGLGQAKEPPDSPLFSALKNQDVAKVKTLLAKGANPNEKNENDTSALMVAAINASPELCRLLLEKGADLTAADKEKDTALEYAFLSGSIPTVKFLLERGAKVRKERSQLSAVIEEDDYEMVKFMLELGYDPNASGFLDTPVLQELTASGNLRMMNLLLDKGADIERTDIEGKTALMAAAAESQDAIVKALIARKANVNAKDKTYKTALNHAAGAKKAAIIAMLKAAGAVVLPPNVFSAVLQEDMQTLEKLLDAGTDPNAPDEQGRTPLHYAAENGKSTAATLLLSRGANPNAKDKAGQTPLLLASKSTHLLASELVAAIQDAGGESPELELFDAIKANRIETVKKLLDKGVSMEAKNSLGQTPLLATYGVLEPRPEIRRLLIERGADINAGDENGITPLHHAVMGGTLAEVKSLVEKGAKVDAARKDGWTPLMNVQGAETDAIIRYLLEKGADVKVKPEGNFTILMAAAEGTSVETYRMLLDKVADTHLNVQNVHGETALDSVIGTREPEKVLLLLERGINPNTQANVVGTTPLMSLIQSAGNYEDRGEVLKLVQAMIDKGAKIGTRDSSGKTAMKLAQEAAWPELIAMLKKAGGKAVAATGAEELKRALDSGSLAAVKQVLAKGVDPNSVVLLDFTALTVASQSGKIELVRALLDKGADPNRRGKEDGALPLHTAADKGHAQIVQLLLKKGANPNLLAQGKTALMAALSKSEAAIAKLLLTSGASPKIKGEDGITTLMTAVFSDEQEIVSLLLSKGVDVNEINDLGSTALSIAASFGRPELTRLLLDKGAKVNVKDSGGNTPLHGAAAIGNLGIVKLLLARKADPNAENNSNETPLSLAYKSMGDADARQQVIQALKNAGAK